VIGEHVFDIRDFDVATPTVLMLRIYPDVRVELQLELRGHLESTVSRSAGQPQPPGS